MPFRLSRKAEQDILALYVEGLEAFGAPQAEDYYAGLEKAFGLLAEFPLMAHERLDFSPPVRVHPFRSHIIIYVVQDNGILVLRVRHGREDWAASDA